eukprot:3953235-Prymnesium_polylepis.1
MLCTCSPRGSPLRQEAQSAPQRGKVGLRHPTLFTFTPPQAPCRPPRAFRTCRGAQTEPGPEWPTRSAYMFCIHRGREGVNPFRAVIKYT